MELMNKYKILKNKLYDKYRNVDKTNKKEEGDLSKNETKNRHRTS